MFICKFYAGSVVLWSSAEQQAAPSLIKQLWSTLIEDSGGDHV